MLNFMALYWPPRLKKRIPYFEFGTLGTQFATLGSNVPAFINIMTSML
jgi:hypothetical protein